MVLGTETNYLKPATKMAVNYILSLCLFSTLLIIGVKSSEDFEESSSDICNQEAKPGRCMAYFPRWYFNSTLNKCTKFIYGGCGGNGNNFKTKEACENTCLVQKNDERLHSSYEEEEEQQKQSSTHTDGKKLKSSRNEQEHQEGPCKHKLKRKLMKIKFFSRLLVHGVPMFRVKHMPTCDEDGFYAPKQCLTDQSECWCVDRLGNKIESSGERHRPEELDCS